MSSLIIQSRLKEFFPTLLGAQTDIPIAAYNLINAPINSRIFDIGSQCEQYLLLTQGIVSVKMRSRNGKSVLLYRVTPGESCIVTTSCLLGNTQYPTFADAQSDIEALSLPSQAFRSALDQSDLFRQFVFNSMGQRLADVMNRLEDINFTSIDSRIAHALLSHKNASPNILITHEKLAEEVGTAREVVSRHLKKLETSGIIKLERGRIMIKNADKLLRLCD